MTWLALLALPAILAIHIFRRSLPRRPVTALWLWGERSAQPASGRRRDRLIDRASLRWELLAACACILALVDPRWFDRPPAQHLAVVLDTRLTLGAERSDGKTVVDCLRHDLAARLAARGAEDRVTVIASGQPPRVLAGPAVNPGQAQAALAEWRADRTWHDLQPALDLAAEIAGAGGAVLLVSDRPAGSPGTATGAAVRVGELLRGEARSTSGIVSARWLGDSLTLRLGAWSDSGNSEKSAEKSAISRIVRVESGTTVLSRQELLLTPGTTRDLRLPIAVRTPIDVVLEGPDAQPADDRCHLLPPTPRMVRWYCPGQSPLRRALEVQDGVLPGTPGDADVVVGDGPAAVGAWRIRVASGTAAAVSGPFLSRRGHPWLDGVDVTGCQWAGGVPLTSLPAESVLLACGGTALLSEPAQEVGRTLLIHGDPAQGSLSRHPAWPALIAQVVADRRAALPGLDDPNLDPGTVVRVVLPADAEALVVDGSGVLRPGSDRTVLLPVPERPGEHALGLRRGGSDAPWLTVSVNAFDARLGDLSPCLDRESPPSLDSDGSATAGRHPLLLLACAACAAVAVVMAWRSQRQEDGP